MLPPGRFDAGPKGKMAPQANRLWFVAYCFFASEITTGRWSYG